MAVVRLSFVFVSKIQFEDTDNRHVQASLLTSRHTHETTMKYIRNPDRNPNLPDLPFHGVNMTPFSPICQDVFFETKKMAARRPMTHAQPLRQKD